MAKFFIENNSIFKRCFVLIVILISCSFVLIFSSGSVLLNSDYHIDSYFRHIRNTGAFMIPLIITGGFLLFRISKKKFKKTPMPFSIQAIDGGFLVQEDDWKIIDKDNLEYVTERKPTDDQIIDLLFAWKVCKYVKSNAIIFAKNQQTIGIGAGQMSRVNSAKIASLKAAAANLDTKESVMASDGFFPFSDSIKMASDNGISCIIQPGGSIKDNEVIEEANKQNIAMVMTRMRHFRH